MKKRTLFVLLGLVMLIAVLSGIKAMQIRTMIAQGQDLVAPPETVTTAVSRAEDWELALTAIGSLSAVDGVTVAAELPGKVVEIAFEPGAKVKKGDLLIRQDTSSEEAQLNGAVAQANLTRIALARITKLREEKSVSESDLDAAVAGYERAKAEVESLRATIAKKTIRAPFGGRLGIRQVNLGQILSEESPIVTLQSLDPIYVDFTLPQQELDRLRTGLPVRVTVDAARDFSIDGSITTLNPLVDRETRNVRLQATVANRDERLRPGMFVNVTVVLPARQQVVAIPATAVLHAPYGDSVFMVADGGPEKEGKVLRQQFVRLGERRGDWVAVTEGVRAGDTVVSTGVFKLRNDQAVVIDNRLAPPFREKPQPVNE